MTDNINAISNAPFVLHFVNSIPTKKKNVVSTMHENRLLINVAFLMRYSKSIVTANCQCINSRHRTEKRNIIKNLLLMSFIILSIYFLLEM